MKSKKKRKKGVVLVVTENLTQGETIGKPQGSKKKKSTTKPHRPEKGKKQMNSKKIDIAGGKGGMQRGGRSRTFQEFSKW